MLRIALVGVVAPAAMLTYVASAVGYPLPTVEMPAPTTLLLLGLGVVGFVAVRR